MRKNITLRDDQYKFMKMLNSEKLMIAFIEFMFEDVEPKWLSENEQILFDSLRVRMELQKARSEAWSNSHWGWRPKKTTNDESNETTKKQQKNNKSNNKKTANKTTKKQEDKEEDISYKIEDINNNNNNNLAIVSETSSQYWDEEVNECLEIIKSFNSWIINGSERKWRQYSFNLIKKLKNIDKVKSWDIQRQDVLKMTLATAKENEFHSSKTTSPELIYYNLSTLLDVCRNEFKKQQGSNTVLHAL